jgi:hypothetical protein
MIDAANKFASEFSVTFNPVKTKYVVYSTNNDSVHVPFVFNDCTIERDVSEIHLGNMVGSNINHNNIKQGTHKFIAKANEMFSMFNHVSHNIKYSLFKTNCMPLYGCQLWDISNNDVEVFYVSWRKCIRRLLKLPNRTPCEFLPIICNDFPVDNQIQVRILKFVQSLLLSDNECVKIACKLMFAGSASSVCNSINYICYKFNIQRNFIENANIIQVIQGINNSKLDVHAKVAVIKECMDIRDNLSQCVISRDEAHGLIQELCIS